MSFKHFKTYAINIFGISLTVYLVKLLFSFWDRSPDLFLNRFLQVPIEQVALVSLALVYCRKLMVFSDAITDVTLPEMSKKFFDNLADFKKSYVRNFSLTFVLISFFAVLAVLWSKEVMLLYSGKNEFIESSYYVPFIMLGVWSYSKINLLKSSIFVPAKKLVLLILIYVSLIVFTYLSFYVLSTFSSLESLLSFSISFGLGGIVSLLFALVVVKLALDIRLLGTRELMYFILSLIIGATFFLNLSIFNKLFISFFMLFPYYIYFNSYGLFSKLFKKDEA